MLGNVLLRMRARLADIVFAFLAIGFGLPSLTFPFGRDQGLFYYIAREWLHRGQVPYRDVWEHKPPLIFVIHAIAIALFGEHMWGIRVLDLFVAVPAMGVVCALLVTPRDEPLRPGLVGAAWLAVSVLYYGEFSYWDTAQLEIWYATFAVAGLVCVLRAPVIGRWHLAAGVLCALALFTKPPAMPFVLVTAAAIAIRTGMRTPEQRRDLLRATFWFAVGGVSVAAVICLYFAAKGTLREMYDILVHVNASYVASETGVDSIHDVFWKTYDAFWLLKPFSLLAILGSIAATAFAWGRNDRAIARPYVLVLALVVSSSLAVWMQLKFYWYHWGTIVVALAAFVAAVYREVHRAAENRWRLGGPAVALGFVLVMFVLFQASQDPRRAWFQGGPATWALYRHAAWEHVRGQSRPEAFAQTFDIPNFYSFHEAEEVGEWLRTHANPQDTVAVRGFEPEIYAICGLHYTGRFFWTTFITATSRPYRRQELSAEDLRWLEQHPPRWAVTMTNRVEGADSTPFFLPLGYTPREVIGSFTILEYVGQPSALR